MKRTHVVAARRSPSARVAVVIVTAVALLASACASSEHGPSARSRKPRGKDATLGTDQTIAALAGSGIATLDDTSGRPLVRVAAPASPVQLRASQVRAMVKEAATGNGIGGSDLDHLGGGTPTPLPVSALLGAYVRRGRTPGAALARRLMGTQDTKHPSTAVFPSEVMLLFASDAARSLGADGGPAGTATTEHGTSTTEHSAGAVRPPLELERIAFTPCSDLSSFIYKTIDKVFAAIHIPPGRVGKTGSAFLDSVLQGLTDIVVGGLNFVINAAKELVVNGIKYVLAQVLDIVAKVATIAALVANMALAVSPWNLIISADDPATSKGVAPDAVKDPVTVSARLDGPDEWPVWFKDCAKTAGVELPPLKPIGAKVTWKVLQVPSGTELVTDRSSEPALYDTALHDPPGGASGAAEATLRLVTGSETPEKAKGKAQTGLVRVDVQIRRTQIEDLRRTLEETANNLASSVLQSIPAVFRSYLLSIVGVGSKQASEDLASLVDGKTSTQIAVTYHGEPDKPKKTTTTSEPSKEDPRLFCGLLRRYFEQAGALIGGAPDDLRGTMAKILDINHKLAAAAPRSIRSAVTLLVTRADAFAPTALAGHPDTGPLLAPDARAANQQLIRYAVNVCHLDLSQFSN